MGYYNTFVVKIWLDEGIMRGHIQHVSTREDTYFLSLEDMTNFMMSHLCPPSNGAVTQEKTLGETKVLTEDFGDIGQYE